MFWKKNKPPKDTYAFVPQKDITPYEVALCLRYFVRGLMPGEDRSLSNYPPEIKRHIQKNGVPLNEIADQLKNKPDYQ
jgi:hypothetical protein